MSDNFNIGRWGLCALLGFVFIFGYEYAVHGILLADIYSATSDLWRSADEMKDFYMYSTVLQIMSASALAYIFALNYEDKGLGEGWRFGVIFGVIFAILGAAPYAWMPIPEVLALFWAVAAFVKLIVLGLIFSLLYDE